MVRKPPDINYNSKYWFPSLLASSNTIESHSWFNIKEIKNEKGDILIDDRLHNGVKNFEGVHIHFGTEKFPNWDEVCAALLSENY